MSAVRVSTWPWPPSFQSLNVQFPKWNSPLQYIRSMGVSEPSCSPAAATTTLNTEPGAYWLCRARFISGVSGSRMTLSHSSLSRLPVSRSSSKAGLEVMARKSPLRGSMKIPPTAAGIHDDHRTRAADHGALRRFLDTPVHRGDDLRPRIRLLAPHDLHGAAQGIHLDTLAPVAATQMLVEQPLEAALADHVPATVATLLHLVVAHLPDIAEKMGREGARRVHAPGLDLHHHPPQREL